MVRTVFVFVSLLAALVAAVPHPFVVHEAINGAPEGFVHAGTPSPDTELTFRIGLVQNNIAGLQEKLLVISDPASATYGQWMSTEEIVEFTKPSAATDAAVKEWLAENGLTAATTSIAGDWLSITTTVGKANTLFNTKFQSFAHPETGKSFIRTLAYSIPASLQGAVEVVHPTVTFPNPLGGVPRLTASIGKRELNALEKKDLERRAIPASCATTITPACIQAIYGVPTTKATSSTVKLGVSGFIDQFAQTADLKSFLTKFRTDISSSTTFALQTLDGGSNPQGRNDAGIEANLDIEYTIGIATGVPVTFISVGENTKDGDLGGFLDIINFIQGEAAASRPQVLTTSYGQNENTVTRAMANSLCNAYSTLGAAGVSILFASGDGGVAGSQTSSCSASFLPTFPSGCPFMTSVGATQGTSPETAASFSSGGFSNFFAQPSYQSAQVKSYLTALGSTNAGKFNTSGRGFPDVAAQGVNFQIVDGGQTGGVDGTSCASPTFAAIISLVNDRLIAAGKPVLGFLNPFLYSSAGTAALTDITTGDNPGCGTNGFPAKAGWDPVTGLGTPNFAKLLTAVGL
ncbi:family S53 protease [Sistotremastrum suecicum HHB10207 ss-3]|uniref:tripeptidyl-peptidase II n=1 Tax=Sistotremastrum suecicum HHB10207 ss-3 TaxID=1314776 RepID=A0A166GKR3_9AGAM|nr:family S53 protease [Sistotremastrum suecicum HHB10207 ss-3]